MSTNEIFNQMLSGYDFSLYMIFFLRFFVNLGGKNNA